MRLFSQKKADSGSVAPAPGGILLVPTKKYTAKTGGMGWPAVWLILFLIAGAAVYRLQRGSAQVSSDSRGAGDAVALAASLPAGPVVLRVTGSVGALRSVSLLAPRILGSRSGVNRGGDTNFGGGPGGGGPGGADFNLVLLSLAKPGSHVKTGDIVGQFDPQNQLQRLDDYKDTVVQLENSVRNMTANLAALKEAHDQSIRTARSNSEKAVLDLQTAPVHSEIDVEKFKLSVEETDATYKQLMYESALVEESQRAQIKISQLNLDQSKIELQRAQNNVEKMTIKAPMDGIVVMASIVRNGEFGQIREGDQVNAGQPFVSIVDPGSMVLNASVNQVDAERLRLGAKTTVYVDAYPQVELPGTLTGIGAMSKVSTFRGTYVGELPIRIQIDRLDAHLIPDLSGSALITVK